MNLNAKPVLSHVIVGAAGAVIGTKLAISVAGRSGGSIKAAAWLLAGVIAPTRRAKQRFNYELEAAIAGRDIEDCKRSLKGASRDTLKRIVFANDDGASLGKGLMNDFTKLTSHQAAKVLNSLSTWQLHDADRDELKTLVQIAGPDNPLLTQQVKDFVAMRPGSTEA